MKKKSIGILIVIASVFLSACASVPMAPPELDLQKKSFSMPAEGNAGIYIFRNSNIGGSLKKSVYIDGKIIGETAPMVYFYQQVGAGQHKLSTESEFGENDLTLQTEAGKNYFVRQSMKIGLFVGGAKLEKVSEEEGKKGVLECKLAQ